jgi:hypothetical protein
VWDIISAAFAAFPFAFRKQLLDGRVTVRGFAPNLRATERKQAHTYDMGL